MIQSNNALVQEKKIYSLNPFGSTRDVIIWLGVVVFSVGIVTLIGFFFIKDTGMVIGAFLGGMVGIIFMRVMMIPITGKIDNANLRALNDRLVSLSYCKSYVDGENSTIISRDVAHWLRWDADQVKVQKVDESLSRIIGPLSIMKKL